MMSVAVIVNIGNGRQLDGAFTNLEAAKRYMQTLYAIPVASWRSMGTWYFGESPKGYKFHIQEVLVLDSPEAIDAAVANRCKGLMETRWNENIPFPMDNNL